MAVTLTLVATPGVTLDFYLLHGLGLFLGFKSLNLTLLVWCRGFVNYFYGYTNFSRYFVWISYFPQIFVWVSV